MVQGRKKVCLFPNCGISLHVSNMTGYCLKHLRERARMLKTGKLKPKFEPRVRVVIDKDGNRTFLG